eukprot:13672125-Alexandrium_andersonii.AAC.1
MARDKAVDGKRVPVIQKWCWAVAASAACQHHLVNRWPLFRGRCSSASGRSTSRRRTPATSR